MDWDDELKRQAAISALLAPPEDDSSGDSYAASMAPSVVQPDDTADYHKWVNSVFDTKTDEQVVAQPDQEQPDKKYDTVTAESVVPYSEAAPAPLPKSDYAPKDTGKGAAPEDYPTVAQDQGQAEGSGQQAPDALTQVERAALVKFPDGTPATMPWNRGVSPDPTKGNLGDEGLSAQILAQAKPDLSDETPIPGFVTTSKNRLSILRPEWSRRPPPIRPSRKIRCAGNPAEG